MIYKLPQEIRNKLAYCFSEIRKELRLPNNRNADWRDATRWIISNHYLYSMKKESKKEVE